MSRIFKLYVLFALPSLFAAEGVQAQNCSNCTVTNPVASGSYTFSGVVCFTSGTYNFNDVSFANNSKVCIGSGATVIINTNISSTAGHNVAFEIAGTFQFSNPPQFQANLNINIAPTGVLKAGAPWGGANFALSGANNTITNNGLIDVQVLDFLNNNAVNVIDNYNDIKIGSNINISGTTTFRNLGNINIGASYNNNSKSTYINCGKVDSHNGFNLGGGKIINTGEFNVLGGNIDMVSGSDMITMGQCW